MLGKMTPDELGYLLWANYPEYQRVTNLEWLAEVFRALTIGGTWCFVAEKRFFKKVDKEHFEEYEI
jgi:hypothetical protein